MHTKIHISYADRLLDKKIKLTKKFLKDNEDLMVTRADKGAITVIVKESEYYQKAENELSDKNKYIKLEKILMSV